MVIIVTGGIGSGKSEVCRIIHEVYGYPVYEADKKAKELYARYPELVESIERKLQCSVRDSSGMFHPALLAERIFGDEDALNDVESLLFPYIVSDFEDFAESSGNIIIFESATVLEKPFFDGFADKVILVDAPREVRLRRACERDGVAPEVVIARMNAQKLMNSVSDGTALTIPPDTPQGRAYARIDEIIINDSSTDDLKEAVKCVMERLSSENINNKKTGSIK